MQFKLIENIIKLKLYYEEKITEHDIYLFALYDQTKKTNEVTTSTTVKYDDYSGRDLVAGFNENSPGRFDMFIDNLEVDGVEMRHALLPVIRRTKRSIRLHTVFVHVLSKHLERDRAQEALIVQLVAVGVARCAGFERAHL